jgi:hypothetical protein
MRKKGHSGTMAGAQHKAAVTTSFFFSSVLSTLDRASTSPPFMSQAPVKVAAEACACRARRAREGAAVGAERSERGAGAAACDLDSVILVGVCEQQRSAWAAGLQHAPAIAHRTSEVNCRRVQDAQKIERVLGFSDTVEQV